MMIIGTQELGITSQGISTQTAIAEPVVVTFLDAIRPDLPGDPTAQVDHFWSTLKTQFGVKRIYYPGCDVDKVLDRSFAQSEIFKLEYDPNTPYTHNLVIGEMERTPFADGIFDVLFIQDIHASPDVFRSTLKTVRDGGLVIYSTADCGGKDGVQLVDVVNAANLRRLSLDYTPDQYNVFVKEGPVTLSQRPAIASRYQMMRSWPAALAQMFDDLPRELKTELILAVSPLYN